MGRKRTRSPDWLPKRCYPHRAQIWYYPAKGKPVALGPRTDPGACLRRYAELAGRTGERPRSMGDVIDKYQLEIAPTKAERTQADYLAYCGKLKQAFGHMLPDEIEITDLYDYHNARRAPVRANREITILGQIYRYAIRWRAATTNPVNGFLYADERARERAVTSSERRRFARMGPKWLRGYLALKYLSGRRQGELLKLTLFSERSDGIGFLILKKRRQRPLVVNWTPRLRRVWAWLKSIPRPKDATAIFVANKGKNRGQALTVYGFKSAWQRVMDAWVAAGGARFHEQDIRAASATAAESDERARELLDHENVRTTRRVYRRGEQKIRPLR